MKKAYIKLKIISMSIIIMGVQNSVSLHAGAADAYKDSISFKHLQVINKQRDFGNTPGTLIHNFVLRFLFGDKAKVDQNMVSQIKESLSDMLGTSQDDITYDTDKEIFLCDQYTIPLASALEWTGTVLKDERVFHGFDYIADKSDERPAASDVSLDSVAAALEIKLPDILKLEARHHKDCFPLYHAVADWNGFWIAVMSEFVKICRCAPHKNRYAFRYTKALDKFTSASGAAEQLLGIKGSLDPVTSLSVNQPKNGSIKDDQSSNEYKANLISLSPTIFAGSTKANESAIGFWINGFAPFSDRRQGYVNALVAVAHGFLDTFTHVDSQRKTMLLEEIKQTYLNLFGHPSADTGKNAPRFGGILFQIFIKRNPDLINRQLYISTPFGFRIKKFIPQKDTTIKDDSAYNILSTFDSDLERFMDSNLNDNYIAPNTGNELCPSGDNLDLQCTQVRMLPRLDWLFADKDDVIIYPHFLDEPGANWLKDFNAAVIMTAKKLYEAAADESCIPCGKATQ